MNFRTAFLFGFAIQLVKKDLPSFPSQQKTTTINLQLKGLLPSPVTYSPSLQLFLGPILQCNILLNLSTSVKNSGFMRSLFFWISFIKSLLNAGGGRQKASNSEKKCRMLSAISWVLSFCDDSVPLKT